jgi:hypothetical protein
VGGTRSNGAGAAILSWVHSSDEEDESDSKDEETEDEGNGEELSSFKDNNEVLLFEEVERRALANEISGHACNDGCCDHVGGRCGGGRVSLKVLSATEIFNHQPTNSKWPPQHH